MEQLPGKGGKTQWKEHVIDRSWSQAYALLWVDLNGDGREDLMTGKRVRAHSGWVPGADEPEALYYYTWDQSALKFTRHTIDSGDAGTGLFIRAADLNRISWVDLVAAGKSATFIFYSQGR